MIINKIYNEDCLTTMSKMNDNFVDMIITSPPYNIIRPNSKDRGYDVYKDGMNNELYIEWTLNIFNEFERILSNDSCVLYNMSYGTENTTLMTLTVAEIIKKTDFTLADIIVWKKNNATPNNVSSNKLTRICEYIYVFCKKNEFNTFKSNKKILKKRSNGQNVYQNVFNFIQAKNNDGSTDLNKATFSVELVRKLINLYANENITIYDPFMGTGTTAVACIIDNKKYIGSEISKKQCEFSNKRLYKYKTQTRLF